jgi:hypothetical protein
VSGMHLSCFLRETGGYGLLCPESLPFCPIVPRFVPMPGLHHFAPVWMSYFVRLCPGMACLGLMPPVLPWSCWRRVRPSGLFPTICLNGGIRMSKSVSTAKRTVPTVLPQLDRSRVVLLPVGDLAPFPAASVGIVRRFRVVQPEAVWVPRTGTPEPAWVPPVSRHSDSITPVSSRATGFDSMTPLFL